MAVRDFLNESFPDLPFIHDKRVECHVYRPDFVYDLSKNPVPFGSKSKHLAKDVKALVPTLGKGFDYEKELKYNKLSIEADLPASIKDNLYDFQKKGIEFGISRFGRVLLGDEMGVGKTI
jgi:SNF2 family DNA or RNA helicase